MAVPESTARPSPAAGAEHLPGASETYTVLVIGQPGEPSRRLCLTRDALERALGPPPPAPVPRRRWPAVAGVAIVVLAGAAFVTARAERVALERSRWRERELDGENTDLRSQLRVIEERLSHIAGTLTRVEAYDAKLRGTLSGLDVTAPLPDVAKPAPAHDGAAASPQPAGPARPSGSGQGAAEGPVTGMLERLESQADRQELALHEADAYFRRAAFELAGTTPTLWPTRGYVTSDFGTRLDPYTAMRVAHHGLDIATPLGQPVFAPSAGKVVVAGLENGYGKVVVIDHGDGLQTRYGHLSAILVKKGDRVERGARIGAVGSTGRSTGPHLHYEVRVDDAPESPRKFIME